MPPFWFLSSFNLAVFAVSTLSVITTAPALRTAFPFFDSCACGLSVSCLPLRNSFACLFLVLVFTFFAATKLEMFPQCHAPPIARKRLFIMALSIAVLFSTNSHRIF